MSYDDYIRERAEEGHLGDPNIWRFEDPAWLSARRDEWRKVQLRLAGHRGIHRSFWKNLKAYFFHGVPLDWRDGPDIEPLDCEFCTWWLHPTGEGLGTFDTGGYSLSVILRQFGQFMGGLEERIRSVGDADYGVMGGREQQLMLALNPGLDYREMVKSRSGKDVPACGNPAYIFDECIVDTNFELRSYTQEPLLPKRYIDTAYFAHRPGLLLWDHLSYGMDIDERLIYLFSPVTDKTTGEVDWTNAVNLREMADTGPSRDSIVMRALTSALTFFDRDIDDESRHRPQTVEYVEMLLGRYERRDFSDPLLKRWDKAKQAIPRTGKFRAGKF